MLELHKCDILIVDDNLKNLQVLGSTLKEAGYRVEAAIDGKEALEWLKGKAFDLVLLDVMMPDMDGFEVCEIIREKEQFDNLPVLFLTAKTDKESTTAGFKIGAQDYITKPFDKGELLARVKTHLELKRSKEILQETNQWLEEKVAERTKELAAANTELMVLDDAKTEFLNIISHEVRTPLNGIRGFIDILKQEIESNELKSYIDMLDKSATRLEKFATTALHISSLKVKKKQIKLEDISINKLIEESIKNMNDQLTQKNIDLVYERSGTESITGDYDLLILCIMNILDNSINYSPNGSCIKIQTKTNDKEVICEVSDDGPGFSKEALKNLFKMFSPGESHVDSNKGLSMSLVKIILDAHNGEIEIRNNDDRGATVKLTFRRDLSN